MNRVYLSLGSNIGNRLKFLNDAIVLIEERIGKVLKRSSVYETEPWGKTDQAMFLNLAICIDTDKSHGLLLGTILDIELELGRIRIEKWYERKIDIDILFYNDEIVNEADLVIPHPYLHERRFVLEPLNEIAKDLYHPVLHTTISDLLSKCTDKTKAKIYTKIEPSV